MKSFIASNKYKNPGVSLLIAVICSTLALVIVLTILTTVSRSVEQSRNLERSTQVFFAVESGLEAGFFHHNARGQGVQFEPILNEEGKANPNFDPAQRIVHSATTIETEWTIDGRAENPPDQIADDLFVDGLIHEDTPLQLRWYWDNSSGVSEDPTKNENRAQPLPNFLLSFDDPTPTIDFGLKDEDGNDEDGVVLSWMLTKKTNDNTQSLVPRATDPVNPCELGKSLFVCNTNLSSIEIKDDDDKGDEDPPTSYTNTLLPRGEREYSSIKSFLEFAAGEPREVQLIVSPLRPFFDTNGTRIAGVPFHLEIYSSDSFPRPNYSVHTRVSTHDFSKDLWLENIPEKTAIQAFSYAIFD